ncbi:MAG: porin [Alphaproteobacteria bacterium]|nr:porin [Alphaproteobacteria bacterium]
MPALLPPAAMVLIAIPNAWGEICSIPNSDSSELGRTFDTRGKTMKKVLLATTALVLWAGVASAEISFSGSAAAGIGRDDSNDDHDYNDGEFHAYNSGSIDISASTETSSGITIGVSTSVSFGTSFAFDDGGFADEDGTIGAPTLTISGSGVTLTFADDGVDHLYSDDTAGDVGVAYSTDTMSVGVVLDVDNTVTDVDGQDVEVQWSANGSFTTSGVTVSAAFDANENYSLGLAYTAGAVSASLENDNGDSNTVTLGYSADGMSAEIEINDDSEWTLSGGYSANGMGVSVSMDDASDWSASASYDLGGASLDAGITSADIAYAGISFSF